MLDSPIITLTTDYGLKDPFSGLMKGAILSINPKAHIVDLTHNIQSHNIFEASRSIAMSYRYFPKGTIHVVVVDPGVGGEQKPILVVTEDHYFIGPDNGTFTLIYEECQSSFFCVYHITASHYFLPIRGNTFHGRDIYAPVAAWLSKGLDSKQFGEPISDFIRIPISKPVLSDNNLKGEIVAIDNFGNAISNISSEDLAGLSSGGSEKELKILFNNRQLPFVNFYSEHSNADLAAVINSFGNVELFTFKSSAAVKFNIKTGDSISVTVE